MPKKEKSVKPTEVNVCGGGLTIDLVNRQIRSLFCLKVNEAVALRCASLVLGDFAAQNIAESRECVVHRLVVNGLVQILDEHIPDA